MKERDDSLLWVRSDVDPDGIRTGRIRGDQADSWDGSDRLARPADTAPTTESVGTGLAPLDEKVPLTGDPDEAGASIMAEVLAHLDDLKARLPVAYHLIALSESADTCASDLGAVVAADPVLTVRLMRLANSAYYGLSGRVATATFAVTVVGFTTVRSLALAAVASMAIGTDLPPSFWETATATAVAAGEIAPRLGLRAQDAFCLGLLASLGQGLLFSADGPAYQSLLDAQAGSRASLTRAERSRYGMSHTGVSAAALRAWSFPEEMVDAMLEAATFGSAARSPGAVALAVAQELAARSLGAKPEDVLDRIGTGKVPEVAAAALLRRVQAVSQELVQAFVQEPAPAAG